MDGGRSEGYAARLRGTQSGECVGYIVQPWNLQRHLDGLIGIARLNLEGDSSWGPDRFKRDEVGLRTTQTVADRLPRLQIDQERRGFCVIEIQHHGLRLGNEAAEKGAQLVQRFMVQGDVVHYGDAGFEKRNRAVALVNLADEELARADPGAGKR